MRLRRANLPAFSAIVLHERKPAQGRLAAVTAPAVFGVPIWHPAKELYSGSVRGTTP